MKNQNMNAPYAKVVCMGRRDATILDNMAFRVVGHLNIGEHILEDLPGMVLRKAAGRVSVDI